MCLGAASAMRERAALHVRARIVAEPVRDEGILRRNETAESRVRRSIVIGMVVGVAATGLVARSMVTSTVASAASTARAMDLYARGLDRLDASLMTLDTALASGDSARARIAFRRTRAAYKRIELFVEYYGGHLTRELNGAPLPKAEDEDPETPLAPVGLQMVEAGLFPAGERAAIVDARRYIPYMRLAVRSLRSAGADTMPGDSYLFDAMRHELSRVATLGLAGFDATVSGDVGPEAAEALEGVRDVARGYRGTDAETILVRLDTALAAAARTLRERPEPADRLGLIALRLVPAARDLAAAQRALGVEPPSRPRAWSARAASIFERDAFDPKFFAATDTPLPTPALLTLGKELFFDPALSASGTRSCATCHLPERAFTDGRARAEVLAGHHATRARNTPTLINAALQPTLFADGRVRTLEDQATDVIGSASEMGGSLGAAARALAARPAMRERIAQLSSGEVDSARIGRTIRLALAAYVRSLVRLDSRFDDAVRGDAGALSPEERRGFELFMGKGRCGTCHFAPLFGGATPPTLVESEPEVIGVPAAARRHHARIDPDSGRFNVRRIDQHLHAFKTPSLRNVALTAPYMHNGVFRTLDEVVDFYDAGGGSGVGSGSPHQTLPRDSLHLGRAEKRAIIAFLGTLTDTSHTSRRPVPSRR